MQRVKLDIQILRHGREQTSRLQTVLQRVRGQRVATLKSNFQRLEVAAVRLDDIVEQIAVDKVCLFPGEMAEVSKVRQSFQAVCVCVAGVHSNG